MHLRWVDGKVVFDVYKFRESRARVCTREPILLYYYIPHFHTDSFSSYRGQRDDRTSN